VRNECQEVYDLTRTNSRLFGNDMLMEVRKRLRDRHLRDIHGHYGNCLYEHLLGISGILTEECKLWWSEEFKIPEEITS
jgi:hypothetical protein